MAMDTPVVVSPSGKGGARPGSGAKKNQHRIHAGELRKAIEEKLGMPFTQMLAETQLKLFNDFNNDHNVKEYLNFTENMSKRMLVEQEVIVSNSSELTDEELRDRAAVLMAKATQNASTPETNNP